MFTGIIEAVGELRKLERRGGDLRVTVATGKLPLADVQLGDSIATNGVCLTVVSLGGDHFIADVSAETLDLTNFSRFSVGHKVNLERAVTPSTRLGGHLVSGHVDGVATCVAREVRARAIEFWLQAPANLVRYLPHKGSVTIDGVSLTLNEIDGTRFRLTIVPHTASETTLTDLKVGDSVHLEVDLLARYLEQLLLGREQAEPQSSGLTFETLARSGFIK
ncbi:riboflavin synthase [Ferrimonas senticii]|uniref:riboflavin synthase n=1 Tax=Ferrimonas senticii TaxID=394566 RepID=UPI0003FE56D9|nr:riboflavin synthase [Ferrimonas senticii]